MIEKFKQLQQGEQVILVMAITALLSIVYYLLIWKPVYESQNGQWRQYEDAIAIRNEVNNYAEQILLIQNSPDMSNNSLIENLSSHVNQSLQNRQLSLSQIQQISGEQVQLRLENVNFSSALAWIYDLESTPGLVLDELSIRPDGNTQTGQVNITVGLSLLN